MLGAAGQAEAPAATAGRPSRKPEPPRSANHHTTTTPPAPWAPHLELQLKVLQHRWRPQAPAVKAGHGGGVGRHQVGPLLRPRLDKAGDAAGRAGVRARGRRWSRRKMEQVVGLPHGNGNPGSPGRRARWARTAAGHARRSAHLPRKPCTLRCHSATGTLPISSTLRVRRSAMLPTATCCTVPSGPTNLLYTVPSCASTCAVRAGCHARRVMGDTPGSLLLLLPC